MSDREPVVVIRGAFNATDALCVVASLTGDLDARVKSDVLFPYYCFDAECQVPTMTGRKPVTVVCMVDAANGLGSTADSFELKKETVLSRKIIETGIDADDAAAVAQRTVTHTLGKNLRTMTSFDTKIHPRGLVYKRFFIVQTEDARLLVDSTTAGWHPLALEAA